MTKNRCEDNGFSIRYGGRSIRYERVDPADIHHNTTWETLGRDHGQVVELSWGDVGYHAQLGPGDLYHRVVDRSDQTTEFYKRVS